MNILHSFKNVLILMVMLVATTTVWAQGSSVAKIGGTEYATLQEAVSAASSGDEITLLESISTTTQIEIAGKEITLNLNGKIISYTGTTTLTSGVLLVHNGAGLTVNGDGGVEAGTKAYAAIALTKKGDDATNPAKLTINGGNFTGYYYVIVGNGNRHNTEITINGGNLTATAENDNQGIYHPQIGTLTINGGTITGYSSAVEMRAGTLNITGGTLTATATEYICNPNGSGTTTIGAAVAIAQHTTKKDIEVNISGGTITGLKAVNESNPQENDIDSQVTINITDGTFDGEITSADVENFISGGTFTEQVDPDYFKEGSVPVKNDAGQYVVQEGNFVAKIGEMKYATLQEAVDAAGSDATITLLENIEENIVIGEDKNITIDLGGFTLNGKQKASTQTILNKGTLTLQNGTVKRSGEGSSSYYIIENKGTMTINATVTGSASASLIRNNAESAVLNITGGTYTQTGAFIVLKNDLGTANVTGGIFSTQSDKAVLNNWSTMNISGGEFTGQILNGAYDTEGNTLTITDGTFNSSKIRTYIGNGKTAAPIEISGGEFTNSAMIFTKEGTATESQAYISGGTFSVEVPAENCADGFAPVQNADGTYGVAKEFIVTDGSPLPIEEGKELTGVLGRYKRTMPLGTTWGTVCLPFTLKSTDAIKLYEINTISDETINLTEVTEAEPGTPLIFHCATAEAIFETEGADVDTKALSTTGSLLGTYTAKVLNSSLDNVYFINGDAFHKANVSLTVPAYRAYIIYNSTSSAKPGTLFLFADNEATEIENITSITENAILGYYTKDGVRHSSPQRGLNIVRTTDGKNLKLMIK